MTGSSDFGTFGRYDEVPVSEMPADMKQAYDYTMELRGVVPGPHKIWLANPALSRTVVPIGAYYQTRSTPGGRNGPALLSRMGMEAEAVERLAYEMAVHDMTEFAQLGRILPELSAAFGHT